MITIKRRRRPRPVACVWTGEHFVPLPRFKRLCDEQFEVHEEYPLIVSEERSMSHHRGYFASVREAWKNLAEEYGTRFPSPDHLRAWALVECGYATETDYVMDSAKDARKLALALRKMSPLAVIQISGNVVKHFEAESQSVPAMKKERFDASSRDVLQLVASMARTTPTELKKNAGRDA